MDSEIHLMWLGQLIKAAESQPTPVDCVIFSISLFSVKFLLTGMSPIRVADDIQVAGRRRRELAGGFGEGWHWGRREGQQAGGVVFHAAAADQGEDWLRRAAAGVVPPAGRRRLRRRRRLSEEESGGEGGGVGVSGVPPPVGGVYSDLRFLAGGDGRLILGEDQ